MSRAAPTMPVSPKMLRHFATLTVALTFCVAIFADGEGREAIEEQLAARQARTALLQAEAGKLGKRRIGAHNLKLRAEKRAYLPFAPDAPEDRGTYGAPMDNVGGGGTGSTSDLGRPGAGFRPGVPPEFAQSPRDGRPPQFGPGAGPSGQPNRNRAARPAATPPTQNQREAILAASRERSGRPDSVE